MSEPSVDEIVADFEKFGILSAEGKAALIADWRKRGEALKPFAKSKYATIEAPDGYRPEECKICDGVSLADLYYARAALKQS